MLKHKVGEIVILNEKIDSDVYKHFKPGIQVKIRELCLENTDDEYYTVHLLNDYDRVWWIEDYEIK